MNTSAEGRTHRDAQQGNTSRFCWTRRGFVFSYCIFHLRQQPWTPMHSYRDRKADTAKRSMFLHKVANRSSQKILFQLASSCLSLSTHVSDGVTPGCLWNGDAYKVQPSVVRTHWMSRFRSMQVMFYCMSYPRVQCHGHQCTTGSDTLYMASQLYHSGMYYTYCCHT